jgi:hypothetical protein
MASSAFYFDFGNVELMRKDDITSGDNQTGLIG